ncbi:MULTISPECIES: 3-hydroxyacyl-CoA dehydrogenase NAD-binding domain-containing protein [Burkholderia cepacia complex]|uniref:3-hydroxyacyl-CoA dehydrogenase NAD-binding domain-containing protein n=1 Tax=Burkholderia cepacia complex TaxID=87882 RepID=UPI0026E0A09C|nr:MULTISPECIES: 3-hydroxyacyl-CoA dehydrogenase NAD-binding domain-containing protein [Burkholderia cepacia complex]MDO5947013.1 3-hydroxyacyl-CoA dehydrogenase NAD-binding domain-containing protein [Burkholderia cepacia]MDS0803650.1 3-hydroxyacyl-CoA dehydrogenase NAD-binding domain-containing protein [Burkholderia cenocepacia]
MFTIDEIYERPIAVIGLGQIGMSWATYFMARGLCVRGSDPMPAAERKTLDYAAAAWPVLEALGLVVEGARPDAVSFDVDVERTVADCGWVQENAPEDLNLKIDLLARIDRAVSCDAVIASSTSALHMTQMQSACTHASRCVTTHPFNPPHLVPLVELVAGEKTSGETLDLAARFYRSIDREPITLNREVFGHVANRLQYVLFNEAARLVLEGVASAADVDRAITWGPGLRWPAMGPFMTFHLAGGGKGTLGAFEKFGPRDEHIDDRAKRIQLSLADQETLHRQIVAGMGETTLPQLEAERDWVLSALYRLKREIQQQRKSGTEHDSE